MGEGAPQPVGQNQLRREVKRGAVWNRNSVRRVLWVSLVGTPRTETGPEVVKEVKEGEEAEK